MIAVDPGVVGVEVPLFPALRIGSDPIFTNKTKQNKTETTASENSPQDIVFPRVVRTHNTLMFKELRTFMDNDNAPKGESLLFFKGL